MKLFLPIKAPQQVVALIGRPSNKHDEQKSVEFGWKINLFTLGLLSKWLDNPGYSTETCWDYSYTSNAKGKI